MLAVRKDSLDIIQIFLDSKKVDPLQRLSDLRRDKHPDLVDWLGERNNACARKALRWFCESEDVDEGARARCLVLLREKEGTANTERES